MGSSEGEGELNYYGKYILWYGC